MKREESVVPSFQRACGLVQQSAVKDNNDNASRIPELLAVASFCTAEVAGNLASRNRMACEVILVTGRARATSIFARPSLK